MKILRCIRSLNPAHGGPLESVTQSTLVLQRRGHEVEIATLDAPGAHEFPAPVHALGPVRGSYGYSARYVPWLKENRARFDAAVVHGLWQYSSFGVWRALHGTLTPYFVFPHGMLDPWFKRTYPLKHVKKMFYWPWAEYRVLRDAAAVLFTSEEERRLARESFALYHAKEVVVNYGTATPEVDWTVAPQEFFEKYPELRGQKFFLFLGRLHEKKGVDLLIKAFASLGENRGRLVIAGPCADDHYLKHLRELAGDLPVIFTGMLSGNLKWGALQSADVFVLSSHQENFGIAVAEALACGTPVLISNKVNIWREVVKDGGGYAENDDFAGTKRLLERWLAVTPAMRAEMSARAQSSFARRFEINQAVDSFLEALQSTR